MKPQASPEISPPRAGQEPELLVRARSGDREAFAALYNEHHDMVFRYLAGRTNRQLAEDLTQEVFARALRRIDTFSWQGRDFGAWLLTIARNIHLDHLKSARNRLEVTVGELHADAANRSAEEDALRGLAEAEAQLLVGAALAQLPASQRECVRLRYLAEQSISETAAAMQRTPGAIKTMANRAMTTMRVALGAVAA
ncbi:sigma-70 family RNA polymerase sigma factor [Streptomyces pacificus]|uniref:RNA polymerase sigma factor n=1 Tax=Streptomyces pacificus TaxID=2705029 RepID=A0A6A0AV70_9ACTN|nr:sigma-70 family RNA polymerase sigma factor [Streptomyces pacificus]GFH36578.1 sigma-70 family RNA polymerase sigma factor [Streptomyces pacificus]